MMRYKRISTLYRVVSKSATSQRGVSTSTRLLNTVQPINLENRNLAEQHDHLYRERFIPLTRRTTVSYLIQDTEKLTDSERKQFEKFALSLDAVISSRYSATLQELKQLFDPISPDKDTVSTRQFSRKDRLDNEFWLLQRLAQVMEKANFYELPDLEVQSRLTEREKHEGVRVAVDMKDYDVLKYWVLGRETVVQSHSLTQRLSSVIRRQPIRSSEIVYKRVIAAVRLGKNDKLTLKAFKEIRSNDLEKLLPVGRVSIGRFDRLTMYTSVGLASIGILAKTVTFLAKMAVTWPLVFAGTTSLIGLRGYWAYKNKKNAYLAGLNDVLYNNNIANNRGLITLVVDRAQDESFKEALLTYTFLQALNKTQSLDNISSADQLSGGITSIALENTIEEWIYENTGATVEFDAAESVDILEKVGILSRKSGGVSDVLSVLPLEAAHRLLPQTPLSILTRAEDSDVTEGYDRSKPETAHSKPVSKFSISRFMPKFR